VAVQLDPSDLLTVPIKLPAASRSQQDWLLAAEANRLSPLPPNTSKWSCHWEGLAANGWRLGKLFFVRASTLAAINEAAATRGLRITGAVTEIDGKTVALPGLFPARFSPRALWQRRTRLLTRALITYGLLLPVLASTCAAFNVARNAAHASLAAVLPSAKLGAAAAQTEPLAALQAFRSGRLAFASAPLIAALSHALPDDTYLTSLSAGGGSLRLQGVTRRAAKLVDALATVPGLAKGHFAGPIIPTQQPGLEQFDLMFTLQPWRP